MKKKIILIGGSRILREMIVRAFHWESELEVVQQFVSVDDYSQLVDLNGIPDADIFFVMTPKGKTGYVNQNLERFAGKMIVHMLNYGSEIHFGDYEQVPVIIIEPDLLTLIRIMKGEIGVGMESRESVKVFRKSVSMFTSPD